MNLRSQMAKSILFAGIPLLTLPLLAESGMSREDRSPRDDGGRSNAIQQIIEGEISKKNGEEITLRTSDGKRITFRINDQTNQLCPEGTQTSQTSSMSKGSSAKQSSSMGKGSSTENFSGEGSSEQSSAGQVSSGQNQMAQGSSGGDSSTSGQTSSSSLIGSPRGQASGQSASGMESDSQQSLQQGFRFGECNFQKGGYVKANIDEEGNAKFVRSMGQSDENYFNAGRNGDEYFVLPAGQLGGLDISDKDSHYSVKSTDGKEIGEVHRTMTNGNGDLAYAIIKKNDGQLISVPWQALEGDGNKSFKLKVTQNQLGNLPILEKGENTVQHVQKHWDLTKDEQQRLAKWNARLDDRNQVRDRYTEDTPTFPNNREGYDRYDQSRSRMSRSGDDRQRHYQDQNAESYQTKRNDFSPTEFPPHDRAFQYEGADQRQYDRQRHYQDQNTEGYQTKRNDFSPTEFPPHDRAFQYEGADQRQYDRQRHYQDQNAEDFQTRRNDFSPTEFPPHDRAFQYEGADQQNSSNRNRQVSSSNDYRNRGNQRSIHSQSREGNYKDPIERLSDRYNTTAPRSDYNSQQQGDDQDQSRRSRGSNYDYRPDGYRP